MKRTIFASFGYEAFIQDRDADTVVVSFAERKESAPFSGEAMLAKTGHAFAASGR